VSESPVFTRLPAMRTSTTDFTCKTGEVVVMMEVVHLRCAGIDIPQKGREGVRPGSRFWAERQRRP
jgi:hypothetical protein